ANQLLAALALLAVAVWLLRKKVNASFVIIPMFFMFTVTLTSLGLFAWQNFQNEIYLLSIIAAGMFVLAVVLIFLARKSLRSEINPPASKRSEREDYAMEEKK